MPSHYALYLKERENLEVLETIEGFAVYAIIKEECYIRDIYIQPEYRQKGAASKIADAIAIIAKEKGCKILTGSVDPIAKGSTESLKVLLGYQMSLHSISNGLIFFTKVLG